MSSSSSSAAPSPPPLPFPFSSSPPALVDALQRFRAAAERVVLDPANHDLLAVVKAARNGAVYGAKVRFPHALVMMVLFRPGTLREKLGLVYRATRTHAQNLARFAVVYKLVRFLLARLRAGRLALTDLPSVADLLDLEEGGPANLVGGILGEGGAAGAGGSGNSSSSKGKGKSRLRGLRGRGSGSKEGPYDSFIAGLIGGYLVFGGRGRSGKIPSVNQQIVIYVFARVVLALARLAIKPKGAGGLGLPVVSRKQVSETIARHAWPVFAAASWAAVMHLFRHHPDDLQPSLRGSMTYIYQQSDHWDSLRNFIWHNK
ncbi:peroxisomal membrane protein 4 [Durotheca rogersii]|uniref:peroxisomal membrane protein 4 n=1 Tax=Durotheca rogersii TaxID=419775 RepID=UPI00221E49F1|nr:peroxisomal membrane protein 4 [Durotheca rogersii]KAI5862198.1 peroxisomal membrane protein 4 [Durotheca rogersii]